MNQENTRDIRISETPISLNIELNTPDVLNSSKNSRKGYIVFGFALLSTIGAVIAFFSMDQSGLLSKFSGNEQVTSNNAASLWQPSDNNPKKSQLTSAQVSKLDLLVGVVLRKGSTMNSTQFITYLQGLHTGITALGLKPQYQANQEVQGIIGYLAYELNSTVVALGGTTVQNSVDSPSTASAQTVSAQVATRTPNTQVSSVDLVIEKSLHDAFFSLHSLSQLRFVENEALYARYVKNPDIFTYQHYLDAREPIVVSGFKNYFDLRDPKNCVMFPSEGKNCFVGGQLHTTVDNGYYFLQFSEETFGNEEKELTAPAARQFSSLNPEFASTEKDELSRFRVYIPKGTVAISLYSYVPQWTRFAVSAKLGSTPSTTNPPNVLEYINSFSKINDGAYKIDHDRLMEGEEVVISSNGGGMFAFPGHERLSLYEKVASNYTEQQILNRDIFETQQGQWLYISQLEGNISNIGVNLIVKSGVYKQEFSKIQWDENNEPKFDGFKNKKSAVNPYVSGNLANSGALTALDQVGENQKWVVDASLNPHKGVSIPLAPIAVSTQSVQ